jgi:hypothetical protein
VVDVLRSYLDNIIQQATQVQVLLPLAACVAASLLTSYILLCDYPLKRSQALGRLWPEAGRRFGRVSSHDACCVSRKVVY